MRPTALFCVVMLGASACLAQTGSPPPALDVPESMLARGLLAGHVSQIDARIAYWVDQLRKAESDPDVQKARTALVNEYGQYQVPEYRYTYARLAGARLAKLLEEEMPLKRLKEVNAAMAMSAMPQVTLSPALGKMVASHNPAVRYLAWQCYKSIRASVLAQSQEMVKAMFDALAAAAARESCPRVVAVILGMLELPEAKPEAVPEVVYREARQRALDIFHQTWPKRCQQVMEGQAEMAEVGRTGMAVLNSFAGLASDKAGAQKLLQMIADMTWCSAAAYDRMQAAGEVAGVSALLLRDCENTLNSVTGRGKRYIEEALSDPKVIDRGAAVKLAVLKWLEDLKDAGVQKPNFGAPASPAP